MGSKGLSIGSDIGIELPVVGVDSSYPIDHVHGVRVLVADIGVCARVHNGHVKVCRGEGSTASDNDISFSILGSIK
jgi:hypothetical protein